MQLTDVGLNERSAWERAGFSMPEYDRAEVAKATNAAPAWIHFGAGNIFRAFQANAVQELLNQGKWDKGLIVAEGYDEEIIDVMYLPHDSLSILVTLKAEGSVEKTVVGSVVEALKANADLPDFARLRELFQNPSLQMASFTITEKGYRLDNGAGELTAPVREDMENGPKRPVSYIGKIAALLYERFEAGAYPIAMVSMDNCSHNGEKLYGAVHAFAEAWSKNGCAKEGFLAYVENPQLVGFPWTMIDKITPRPDERIRDILADNGVDGLDCVVTSKNTYVAPFVNAEECQYLVIEDAFPNGHPPLEEAGILFTTREKVEQVERMKVCTCLNPLHTALAIFGCLLGYDSIAKEMQSPLLRAMVERIGYTEGMPVVTDPGIIRPVDFLNEVVQKRIPNVFMPDTPQRIASDTSQKLSIRFGETIQNYRKSGKDTQNLVMIPLVCAGWLRYLMAVDDEGRTFMPSPDPMLDAARAYVAEVRLGEPYTAQTQVKELLSRTDIFGVDLYEDSLGERIEGYFQELIAGVGAVRHTLEKYVGQTAEVNG